MTNVTNNAYLTIIEFECYKECTFTFMKYVCPSFMFTGSLLGVSAHSSSVVVYSMTSENL